VSSYPPMYFTLRSALGLSGTPSIERNDPVALRKSILEKSEYREENRELWRQFIKENPNDETAKFVKLML
jgi:hypothetical protein